MMDFADEWRGPARADEVEQRDDRPQRLGQHRNAHAGGHGVATVHGGAGRDPRRDRCGQHVHRFDNECDATTCTRAEHHRRGLCGAF